MNAGSNYKIAPITVYQLRDIANIFFLFSNFALTGLCVAVSWVGGQNVIITAIISGSTTLFAVISISKFGQALTGRLFVSVSFAVQVMMLIFAASNLNAAFVEEAHMIYFVLNCYLLAYACWRSLIVYNVLIVVHHLVLTFVLPKLVWSAGESAFGVYHLGVHALVATILVGPLMFTAEQLRRTIVSNGKALEDLNVALEQASANAARADHERNAAEQRASSVKDTAGIIDIRLQTHFKDMAKASLDVGLSAREVAEISSTCGANTRNADQSFERTAIKMREVAGSADVLAQSAIDIARRAEAATAKTKSAVAAAVLATKRVNSLMSAGVQVAEVATIIRQVAESINLLALNATIEAARAGDAGRGFAVVAQSVKTLAGQTRNATGQISQYIVEIQGNTHEAVKAIGIIGTAVEDAHGYMLEIAQSTANQTPVTASIAERATSVAQEAALVRKQVSTTLSLLISAQSMSETLSAASAGLKSTTEDSTADCDKLLAQLRIA